MKKYIVCCYNKITSYVDSFVFGTKKEALVCIAVYRSIDLKYNEEKNWFYKVVEVKFYE